MATNYPTALDSLINPTGTDTLDSATVPHASQHANTNDAIEAIEATLGTNPQGSSATVKDRFGTVADLASPNAFAVGGHTITSETATVKPLIIKGADPQTANLQEFQNSAGAPIAQITSAGGFTGVSNIITTSGIVRGLGIGSVNAALNGIVSNVGVGHVVVQNVSVVPNTPSGAGVIYVESGALKYKGSSGTITTLATA